MTIQSSIAVATTQATAGSWIEELYMPIMQLATGIMVAASMDVAYTMAPKLALLPALVGIGLVATGITSILRAYETSRRK